MKYLKELNGSKMALLFPQRKKKNQSFISKDSFIFMSFAPNKTSYITAFIWEEVFLPQQKLNKVIQSNLVLYMTKLKQTKKRKF